MRCGKSRVNRRPRSSQLHQLALLREYATNYDNKTRSAKYRSIKSRSTAYRRLAELLELKPTPLPILNPTAHTAIMLDGFYIAYPSIRKHRHLSGAKTEQSILLVAIDAITRQPLYWSTYRRLEDTTTWILFFEELVEHGLYPNYLIHDGHVGIVRASAKYLPNALHQRCLVHMVRNAHKDIGLYPKAPQAKQLLSLIYRLVQVRTEPAADQWLADLHNYQLAYQQARVQAPAQTSAHSKAFLSLYTVLSNASKRNELFTFLDHPELPYNTNDIESLNHVLRETLGRHRGMNLARREALVSWILLFRSEPDLRIIRKHVWQ
jgi:hypothetical protein